MRTTLTLDEDVAALLRRILARRKQSLKEVVNQALREGLRRMTEQPRPSVGYCTPGVDLGRCLVGNVDDVAEVLDIAEGRAFR
ncbi:MAG: ribbon-helix-helix protein, CopG family [Candidatus Rokubacteria bacterium]|nr:ribbon-helix-helix protein, CopG family [Candidatus Rokubacteria bacterium]